MKKILFIVPSMKGGGVEKVLLNMIKALPKDKYEMTVMAILDEGERKEELPPNVNYRYVWKRAFYIGSKRIRGTDRLFQVIFKKLSPKLLHKIFIKENYDIEVDYWGQEGLKLILGGKNNIKKLSFIHTDMNAEGMRHAIFPFKNSKELRKAYLTMDYIVNVSDDCRKSMKERFKLVGDEQKKNVVRYNINLNSEIIQKSNEEIELIHNQNKFILCTSGRLCQPKGFERLVYICHRLREQDIKFELWILGEGEKRKDLEAVIDKYGLKECVKLLGYQKNPYKYMAKSELFVCSSFYEGFSTVVSEAVILGIPIVTTDCTGAKEILGDSEYGLVTGIDDDSLFEGLRKMLTDKQLYQYYKNKVLERQAFFDMNKVVTEIEQLFE